MNMPLADVVLFPGRPVVQLVEIALQKPRVPGKREGPMLGAWTGWTGTSDLKGGGVRATTEENASGLASWDRARMARERGPD
jgi:hypothetical protein